MISGFDCFQLKWLITQVLHVHHITAKIGFFAEKNKNIRCFLHRAALLRRESSRKARGKAIKR